MKQLLIILLLLLSLTASPIWSADFDKGVQAYENGDYATALTEWAPLAEQGNANAQFNLTQMYRRGEGVPQSYKMAAMLAKVRE